MISVQDAATNWPVYSTLHTDTATALDGASSRRTQAARGGSRGQQQQWLCVSFEQLQHTVHSTARQRHQQQHSEPLEYVLTD